MPRIYFDMDGVMARFHNVKFEELLEKGYFLNLEPMQEVAKAVNRLNEMYREGESDLEVFVLSAYLPENPYAKAEKGMWLDRYTPGIDVDHRLFIECRQGVSLNKATLIPDLSKTDILVDDYNPNLEDWVLAGGTGIKLLNGINDKHKSWGGLRVSAFSSDLALQCLEVSDEIKRRESPEFIKFARSLSERLKEGISFAKEFYENNLSIRGPTVEAWHYGYSDREWDSMSRKEQKEVRDGANFIRVTTYTPDEFYDLKRDNGSMFLYLERDYLKLRFGLQDNDEVESWLNDYTEYETRGLWEDALRDGAKMIAVDFDDASKCYFTNISDPMLKDEKTSWSRVDGVRPDIASSLVQEDDILRVKDVLDLELVDDIESLAGGVAFAGETVADYVSACGIGKEETLDVLNANLEYNGILPIPEEEARQHSDKYKFVWSGFSEEKFSLLKEALFHQQFVSSEAMDLWNEYYFGSVYIGALCVDIQCGDVQNSQYDKVHLEVDPRIYLGGVDDGYAYGKTGYPYASWSEYGPEELTIPLDKNMSYSDFQKQFRADMTQLIKDTKNRVYTYRVYTYDSDSGSKTFNLAELAAESGDEWKELSMAIEKDGLNEP